MAYATFRQLESAYHQDFLDRIALRANEDVDSVVIQARCEASLDAAAGVIDSYLNRAYAVPVVTPVLSAQAALRNCCMALAVADLIAQKGYIEGTEDASLVDHITKRYLNTPNGWLYRVGAGSVVIPGAISPSDGSSTSSPDGFYCVSEEPYFPPSSLYV